MDESTLSTTDGEQTPPARRLIEGVHFYREGAYVVFTELYLRERGYCCESGCRHCPYGYDPERRSDLPQEE